MSSIEFVINDTLWWTLSLKDEMPFGPPANQLVGLLVPIGGALTQPDLSRCSCTLYRLALNVALLSHLRFSSIRLRVNIPSYFRGLLIRLSVCVCVCVSV